MILVTGATGTTGREVVHELCERSRRVRALVRDPRKASSIQSVGAQVLYGDLMRPETLDSALDGVHCVFLLAANTPDQVRMEANLVSAARRAGVHRVVKLSVLGANRNSRSVIARWHREAEELVERSGMSFTHLRANFFMQNMLGFAPSIRKWGSFFLPVRNAKVGAVDVRDIAAVAAAALIEPGHQSKAYTVTGPESVSFSEIADRLSRAIGKTVRYVDGPLERFKDNLLKDGQAEWYVEAMNEFNTLIAEGDNDIVTDAVVKLTGRAARPFDQFFHDYADCFR